MPLIKKFTLISKSESSIIARLYRYTTLLLNLKPDNHEYKVMGLAAFSKDEYTETLFNKFKKIQTIQKNKFKFFKKSKDLYFFLKDITKGERFDNIAGAVQRYTEFLIENLLKICEIHRIRNLCFAGGVAMNVKRI